MVYCSGGFLVPPRPTPSHRLALVKDFEIYREAMDNSTGNVAWTI